MNCHEFEGRELERLKAAERLALAGHWIALERYDTQRLPLRKIAAVGDSAAECIEKLAARGQKPTEFEFSLVSGPF